MKRLAFNVLAALWWVIVGAGAVYFLTYKPTEAPAKPQKPKASLRVEDSKAIGPNEELRVIWMPSSVEGLGSRCLLYTNRENSASSLSCATDISE